MLCSVASAVVCMLSLWYSGLPCHISKEHIVGVQVLTLVADQVAATPQLPRHGLVTSLTALHGLDGRHLAQVSLISVCFLNSSSGHGRLDTFSVQAGHRVDV